MPFGLTNAPSKFEAAKYDDFIGLTDAPLTFQTCFIGKGEL